MILTLKAQRVRMLDGWTLEIMTNCEDFRAMLDHHSPNLLIDYLRERCGLKNRPCGIQKRRRQPWYALKKTAL